MITKHDLIGFDSFDPSSCLTQIIHIHTYPISIYSIKSRWCSPSHIRMILQCSESTDFTDRRRWESLFLMQEDHLNRTRSATRSANQKKNWGSIWSKWCCPRNGWPTMVKPSVVPKSESSFGPWTHDMVFSHRPSSFGGRMWWMTLSHWHL